MDDVLAAQSFDHGFDLEQPAERLMYSSQQKKQDRDARRATAMAQRTQEKLMSLFTSRKRAKGNGAFPEPGSGGVTPVDSWQESPDFVLPQQDPYHAYVFNQLCQLELKHLATNCPKGVYVMPSESDERIWHGVVFVAEGPYASAVFRFVLRLPDPASTTAPSVHFTSFVWHPQVDPDTGAMTAYIQRHYPVWNARECRISDILQLVAMAFYNVDCADAANNQAAEMCMADAKLFEYRVLECIHQAQREIYHNDTSSSIVFRQYNPGVHDRIHQKMLDQNYEGFAIDLIDMGVKVVSQITSMFKADDSKA